MNPKGLSRVSAASYIGVSPNTFLRLVEEGSMPRPRLIGRRKFWDIKELDAFFEELPRDGEDDWNDWDESIH